MFRKTASNPDTTREAGIGGPRPPGPGMTPTPLQVVVAVPTPTTPVPASAPRLRPTRAAPPPASADASPTAAPAPAPKPSGPIADGRTYSGSINLPGGGKIELGGIVWSETEPRALLNDRVVGADSYVEGYRVVKIEEDRVALEKDGVTLYITVQ